MSAGGEHLKDEVRLALKDPADSDIEHSIQIITREKGTRRQVVLSGGIAGLVSR
jgi:hypothetical protein